MAPCPPAVPQAHVGTLQMPEIIMWEVGTPIDTEPFHTVARSPPLDALPLQESFPMMRATTASSLFSSITVAACCILSARSAGVIRNFSMTKVKSIPCAFAAAIFDPGGGFRRSASALANLSGGYDLRTLIN